MIGVVALVLVSVIYAFVKGIFRRKGADAPRGQQLALDSIHDICPDFLGKRRILQRTGKYLIGPHIEIPAALVHIVRQMTASLIPEHIVERSIHTVFQRLQGIEQTGIVAVTGLHIQHIGHSIVPESIGLHLIPCPLGHWIALAVISVHPRHGHTVHPDPEQAVVVETDSHPASFQETPDYGPEPVPVLQPYALSIARKDRVLLYGPDEPESRIGLLGAVQNLLAVYLERTFHDLLESACVPFRCQSKAGQGYHRLPQSFSQPRIAAVYLFQPASAVDDELLGRPSETVVIALQGYPLGLLPGKYSRQALDRCRGRGDRDYH